MAATSQPEYLRGSRPEKRPLLNQRSNFPPSSVSSRDYRAQGLELEI